MSAVSPTATLQNASSQPAMTAPWPSVNVNGVFRFREQSKGSSAPST